MNNIFFVVQVVGGELELEEDLDGLFDKGKVEMIVEQEAQIQMEYLQDSHENE